MPSSRDCLWCTGLYASLVPVVIASLWGSLSQLHTGPVAMLSLMSAAALISFATFGSPKFIELSVMLPLMVGALRLALGLLRLGVVVNFLSEAVKKPVVRRVRQRNSVEWFH